MKHTITITYDDEACRGELVNGDGRYTFTATSLEFRRAPADDLEEMNRRADDVWMLKAGPVLELSFRGTILSESKLSKNKGAADWPHLLHDRL